MATSEWLQERSNAAWNALFNQILDFLLILMNTTAIMINLIMVIYRRTERSERQTQTD